MAPLPGRRRGQGQHWLGGARGWRARVVQAPTNPVVQSAERVRGFASPASRLCYPAQPDIKMFVTYILTQGNVWGERNWDLRTAGEQYCGGLTPSR